MSNFIYGAGDEQQTLNLGLSTWGMDEVLAQNMILIDTAFGVGSSVHINGSVISSPNFINSATVTFSVAGSNVSATAASGGSSAWASLTGDMTETQVAPWDGPTVGTPDTGISRLAAGSLAIGNGTPGDATGALQLASLHIVDTLTGNEPFVYQMDITFNPASPVDNLFCGNINITSIPAAGQNGGIIGKKVLTQFNGTASMTGDTSCFEAISLWNSSGNVSELRGFTAAVVVNGGTATQAVGFSSDVRGNGAGVTGEIDSFLAYDTNQTGAVTNWYGLRVNPITFAGGSVAHLHAIHIDDITNGGASNPDPWAIFVVAGKSSFGGPVLINSTLVDGTNSAGILGQVLSSTATGVEWSANLSLNRVNVAGIDFAGTATVTAAATSVTVTYAANYTGAAAPVVVVTPTSDPLAAGIPVGYWVVATGVTTAWTGFTINIQTALAGNVIFGYHVIGKA